MLFPSFSNNSLSALPASLSSFITGTVFYVNMSRNAFNASGVDNFRAALGLTGATVLDLSFNDLGPTVPPALAQWPLAGTATLDSLLLQGCAITDIPANTFAGSAWQLFDLSLNDLRSGLHPHSFSGSSKILSIRLSSCNLRGSSLMPGVFDVATAGPARWTVYLDNLPADNRGVSAEEYSARLSNYFDPFPAGVLYTLPTAGYTVKQPSWQWLTIGGERRPAAQQKNWLGQLRARRLVD